MCPSSCNFENEYISHDNVDDMSTEFNIEYDCLKVIFELCILWYQVTEKIVD